jgi:hypothetical protein
MMKVHYTVSSVTISLVCWLSPEVIAVGAEPLSPAITTQQIEADWLRQDELRNAPATPGGERVTPEEDAAGGCDGVIDGKWGFHTENEDRPWWQVDLGKSVALDRIVLYNRSDLAQRNARIIVLLSDDAKQFHQAYQHDGTVFYGHSDQKPLSVALDGARARYVGLTLRGRSYFHLDEVQIYASGAAENMALGQPATQSSTSQWSARHVPAETGPKVYATQRVIQRGLKLAESLRRLGADVDAQVKVLEEIQAAGGWRLTGTDAQRWSAKPQATASGAPLPFAPATLPQAAEARNVYFRLFRL